MANKRPGYTRLEFEMPDELVEALDGHCVSAEESRTCFVNRVVDASLGTAIPPAKLCPVRGRPTKAKPGRPPAKPNRGKK